MVAWNPRANEIFLDALEIPAPDDRRLFMDRACEGDHVLRGAVEALFKAHTDAGNILDQPRDLARPLRPWLATEAVCQSTVSVGLAEKAGSVIVGRYKLLQQIGEGGMGVVWMAEQQQPVRRMVALKVIRDGLGSAEILARFEAERQALALMDHPSIARVLDAGTTNANRPFFVMELVFQSLL